MKEIYDPVLGEMVCVGDGTIFGVESVRAKNDYTLTLRFSNGEQRVFDARKIMDMPIFRPLENVSFFLQAHTDGVAVVWNDEIDVAPEYLYENSEPA